MSPIRIGTRGSPLALAQARDVARRLAVAHGLADDQLTLTIIKTSGDRIQDRPLSEVGGKGLFTKELEDALLGGAIDLAVHSMKDVATVLPDQLTIAAILEREDPRDAFISRRFASIEALPAGARLGTSSLRRAAQILHARPDLTIVPFRGNVGTRLEKLDQGIADATLLAVAGLNRLGMTEHITQPTPVVTMRPAVAQGAVGIEIRRNDEQAARAVQSLNHTATATAVACERAFLARLDGSCRTPIAGLATIDHNGKLVFDGEILLPDGTVRHVVHRDGMPTDATRIGDDAALDLLSRAGRNFLRANG